MRMRTFLPGSIQSKLTCLLRASEATISAKRKAISRTSFTSGPLTRYCTGQPTGGPSSSGTVLVTALGKSSRSTRSSFTRSRSRAAMSLAMITNWLKKSLGSSTLSGR